MAADILYECFADNKPLPQTTFLFQYKVFQKEQIRNTTLLEHIKDKCKGYALQQLHVGGKFHKLICHNGKITVPETL